MSFEVAVRLTELMLGWFLCQQSAEHMAGLRQEAGWFLPRFLGAAMLMLGMATPVVCVLLWLHGWAMLYRFQGPYNGGSDRMGLLILTCLTLAHVLPQMAWREYALGYLAMQLVISYWMAGWVKLVNPDWRRGRALRDVFQFSTYPVSEGIRRFADKPRLLWGMSWAVMGFELAFPLVLLHPGGMAMGLLIAACFHLSNACLFGLNRFFWCWLAAYPSLWWLQERIGSGG